jgi:hypothetical protein
MLTQARSVLVTIVALSAWAASDTPSWLPLPIDGVTWADGSAPSAAALHDRAQIVVITDGGDQSYAPDVVGRAGSLYRQIFLTSDSVDTGFMRIVISSNGSNLRAGKASDTIRDAFGTVPGNLLNAVSGSQWPALAILVDRNGLVLSMEPFSSDQGKASNAIRKTIDRVVAIKGEGLIVNRMEYPPDCQPALDRYQIGDLSGCLKMASKLGKAGSDITRMISTRIVTLAEADASALDSETITVAERFVRGRRLQGLIAEMPAASKGKGVNTALKAWNKDEAMKKETAAWQELGAVLAALQSKKGERDTLLSVVSERNPGTYAAALAATMLAASTQKGVITLVTGE